MGTVVDGVRLGHVRRCACGRAPDIATTYVGFEPGTGPFIITCYCGAPEDAVNEHGFRPHHLSRSWSKTRAVRNWNQMVRSMPTPARPRRQTVAEKLSMALKGE